MFEKLSLDKIKETVSEFFRKTGFDVLIDWEEKDGALWANIKTDIPQILIGEKGQTLSEIQHLLKLILKKKIITLDSEFSNFILNIDINDYKKKKEEYLKELAKEIADEVSLSKKERTLSPMSSYERRIIHMVLVERDDVITESIGEGTERRIIIKPFLKAGP